MRIGGRGELAVAQHRGPRPAAAMQEEDERHRALGGIVTLRRMDERGRPILRDQPHGRTLTRRWKQAGSRSWGGKQAERAERKKGVLHA